MYVCSSSAALVRLAIPASIESEKQPKDNFIIIHCRLNKKPWMRQKLMTFCSDSCGNFLITNNLFGKPFLVFCFLQKKLCYEKNSFILKMPGIIL